MTLDQALALAPNRAFAPSARAECLEEALTRCARAASNGRPARPHEVRGGGR